MPRPRTISDEAILQAAARAVGVHGAGGLTLGVVAGEVGLAPATLVQRFGSKRGLLLAVAARGVEATARVFARARDAHESPTAALVAALGELASGMRTREELANNLAFLQLGLADPEFRTHAVAQAHRLRDEIAKLLDAAVFADELRDEMGTARTARMLHVVFNGTMLLWAVDGEGDPAELLREEVMAVLGPYRR